MCVCVCVCVFCTCFRGHATSQHCMASHTTAQKRSDELDALLHSASVLEVTNTHSLESHTVLLKSETVAPFKETCLKFSDVR